MNFEQLENKGMINLMYHQLKRFKKSHGYISDFGCWKKWIRNI